MKLKAKPLIRRDQLEIAVELLTARLDSMGLEYKVVMLHMVETLLGLDPAVLRRLSESPLTKEELANAVRQAIGPDAGFSLDEFRAMSPMSRIVRVTCHILAVDTRELGTNRKTPLSVLARAIIAKLGRERAGVTYAEIAEAIGKKSHTSAVMAHQRLNVRLEVNEVMVVPGPPYPRLASVDLQETVSNIETMLTDLEARP